MVLGHYNQWESSRCAINSNCALHSVKKSSTTYIIYTYTAHTENASINKLYNYNIEIAVESYTILLSYYSGPYQHSMHVQYTKLQYCGGYYKNYHCYLFLKITIIILILCFVITVADSILYIVM